MSAVITNSTAVISKADLTTAELKSIKDACTYKDQTIVYAIKRASSTRWGAKTIPGLKEKLVVTLYEEDDDSIAIPQGMKYLIPSHIDRIDQRVLPTFKEMVWFKRPEKVMRYYQRDQVDALKGDSRGQIVSATGTGKSFTMLNLVKETGLRTLIICPSSLIGDQLYADFSTFLGKKDVGMYGSGKKEIKRVTIGLYQSVTKNIDAFKDFDMVITDENQTLGASSLTEISRGLSHVPYFYSLSATNWRADGKTPEIYAASGDVLYNFDTKRAISEGFLAQPVFIVREVPSSGRDYDLKQKNYTHHVVKNELLTKQIIADIQKVKDKGMSTLVLVQEIEHGEMISQALGVPFANGENKNSMDLIRGLNSGSIKILVAGASMTGVGVDTVRVDCLVMASFPGTEGLTLQLLGRGLRKYPGKEKVLVLDYWLPNSQMLGRHALNRIEWYKEYGPVKIIRSEDVI